MIEQQKGDVSVIVRSKLANGMLPRVSPAKVWVGHGTGQTCSACDLRIDAQEVEYETDMPDGAILAFHQGCLAVWHAERTNS